MVFEINQKLKLKYSSHKMTESTLYPSLVTTWSYQPHFLLCSSSAFLASWPQHTLAIDKNATRTGMTSKYKWLQTTTDAVRGGWSEGNKQDLKNKKIKTKRKNPTFENKSINKKSKSYAKPNNISWPLQSTQTPFSRFSPVYAPHRLPSS